MAPRQVYSKEQWDAQKHTIEHLYVTQNLTFQRVVEILGTQHQFHPTRKQFYRKIDEWNLKKNVKKSEMRAIVESMAQGETNSASLTLGASGRCLTPAKIGRWKKKHGKVEDVVCSFRSSHEASIQISPLAPSLIREDSHTLHGELFEGVVWHSFDPLYSQKWSEWATVDVPGSPNLSRLFQALTIERSKEIPPIALDDPISSVVDDYIKDTFMSDVCETRKCAEEIDPTGDPFNLSDVSCHTFHSSLGEGAVSTEIMKLDSKRSFSEWASDLWDFSRGCPYNTKINLFYELSPFPIWPPKCQHATAPDELWIFGPSKKLLRKESDCVAKLKTLESTLDADSFATVAAKDELAQIFWEKGDYSSSEKLWRDIAFILRKTLGPRNMGTLSAELQMIKAIALQRGYAEIENDYLSVHSRLLKVVSCDHVLALDSLLMKAQIYFARDEPEEGEKICRRLLQIFLNTEGPRSDATLRIMSILGYSLRKKLKLTESEQLMQTAVCLHHEIKDRSKKYLFRDLRELSRVIAAQGRYAEYYALANNTAEQSETVLGPEHPDTLYCYFEVAWNLGDQEQWEESIDLLNNILERQSRILGCRHLNTIRTMSRLAWTLAEAGRGEEATVCSEDLIRTSIEKFGKGHPSVADICFTCGICFEKQYMYEKALYLYIQTWEFAISAGRESHSSFLKIYDRARLISEYMRTQHKWE